VPGNPSPAAAHHRAKLGGLKRSGVPSHDPRYAQTRAALAAQVRADRIARLIAEGPLTDEQLDRVAALLRRGS
jgi:hypothetical protein